ncbi:hypothetical protein IFM89_034060 [Coptis chinensis]|uniref:Uncharacterized protein n=1 Tax=Coptis chinensis TaxID=261450 RepID=A0A835M851_9MAGN|nr:hypothetical protein IFM89_034060 [Coptis chinensis]
MMDDGELDFSNVNMNEQFPSNCSMDSLFDEILKDTHACTHTHTCNPPGPDLSHSHTCVHVHTKILPAQSDDKVTGDDSSESTDKKAKKRPTGNREAVLDEKIAGSSCTFEVEVARLKCLLVDIRGRIEGKLDLFPYQKPSQCSNGIPNIPYQNLPGGYVVNPCDLRCNDQMYCYQAGMGGSVEDTGVLSGQGSGACDIGNVQCIGNLDSTFKDLPDSGRGNVVPTVDSSAPKRRRGKILHA